MSDYDAIVIGAGNAGLTAATTLQRGGAKTLLLERHNIPGGCATSFVRGNFEFEVALHQLSGMGTEQNPFILRKIFAELGIMDKLDVVIERDLYRMVMPSPAGGKHEIDVTLPASWKGLKATLVEQFPDQARGIEQFMQLCEGLAMECFMVLPKIRQTADENVLKSQCPLFVQYGLQSVKSVLDGFFDNADLKAVIAAYWCYVGMPPKDFAFRDLAIMLYAYAAFKPCHVKGGSQAISSALLESFIAAGGEVKFNCGAKKIITDNDVIKAVETEHGDVITCQHVVSNASPIHTFNELLDVPTPKQASQDMKSRRLGTSAFVLYIGLDCEPSDIGVTAASSFIIDDRNEDVAHELMQSISAPKHTMLTCYNYDDPSFAPPGKTALSLLCLQYGEPWQQLNVEQYAKTKYELAEKLLDHAERVFPNIRAHIEEVEVATPLTMMRYLNTPGGAIYGFQQNTQDANIFRRRIDEITGLHFAGCWFGMGGFQPTYMVGQTTAKQVLKAINQQQQANVMTQVKQEVANV
ncbi:phytoene desaturase family protein [Shewanella maritima]|uniref:phytoene desaturase family protein n=1 Tax=Shewanella maritima TaxID=2520507 RepID=UPI0037371114